MQSSRNQWERLQAKVLKYVGPPLSPPPSDPNRFLRWDAGYAEFLSWMPDLRGIGDRLQASHQFRGAHHGLCAICFRPDDQLMEDHDHQTGLVRGLLCRGCNRLAPSHTWQGPCPRDHSYAYCRFTQWPPSAAAGYRASYMSTWGRPDPDLVEILWIVGEGTPPERN